MYKYRKELEKIESVNEELKIKEVREVGYITLTCPYCGDMHDHFIDSYSNINNIDGILPLDIREPMYRGTCKKCGEDYVAFETIDINIAPIIKILNDKGYYTMHSCEGHIKYDENNEYDTEISAAYIYFFFASQSSILDKYPLPESWYIGEGDRACNIFSIKDTVLKTITENDMQANEAVKLMRANNHKEKVLKEIYDWAESLPKAIDIGLLPEDTTFEQAMERKEEVCYDNMLRLNDYYELKKLKEELKKHFEEQKNSGTLIYDFDTSPHGVSNEGYYESTDETE